MAVPAPHQLQATVEKVDGPDAVLQVVDGQTLRWPLAKLPEPVDVGAAVAVEVLTEAMVKSRQETLARQVLNTLLKS